MKKKILSIIMLSFIVIASFALTMSLAGCDNGNPQDPDNPPQNVPASPTISLNYKNILVYEQDTFELVATVTNTDEVVEWISSDEEVVTVSNGLVRGVNTGSAVITAKIREAMATCTVTVEKTDVFEFTSTEKKIYVGKSYQLNLKHLFKGEEVSGAQIQYTSNNTGILTVDSNGYITGIKIGEAIVTAEYAGLKAEIKVVVANLITLVLDVEEVTLNPNLPSNNTLKVTGTVKKNGINVKNATINWSVMDDAMIKVSSSGNVANLSAVGCGNTALVAEYEGEFATCIITSFKTVSTIADVEAIKQDINGWFKVVNDIDFTGYAWSSITPWAGDPVNPELYFGGIFDGQGYTFSNITCLSGWHQGLFGQTNENSIIKNISLINFVNQATSNKSASIVSLNYGLVENVYAETTIQGDSQSMWNAHGGLVATNYPSGIVRNSIVVVKAGRVFKNTGALCGYNCGIFENCFAVCEEAVLPTVFTQTSDYGSTYNTYTYSSKEALYGSELFKDYDRNIWNISDYSVPTLMSYPAAKFESEDTYLTIGYEYIINPFNVKGLDVTWEFDGDKDSFDYYIMEDGTLNVLPLESGELNVYVELPNGNNATTTLVSKGVVLVPNKDYVSLDYLNPGLEDEFVLSFMDEDNNLINNKDIKYISNNEDVITVTDQGLIKAIGGGSATLTLEYKGDLYVNLIKIDVTEWIQISTAEQFNNIRQNVYGNYCLINDIDYGGKTFSTIGIWDGIEDNGKHFAGTLDGNGFTISNLVLPSEGDTSGIWGQTLPSSVIRNVNFINISSPSKSTDNYGIVGFNTGVIENVYVEMTVTCGGKTSIRSGGGVVGTNEFRGVVSNCISVIKVENLPNGQYFGSLCGLNQGVLQNSFSIVYGNGYNSVNAVSYDNGSVLATAQYANVSYKDALKTAIAKQSPFGSFDKDIWVIVSDQLPKLKQNK